jgi:hypothetical protein
MRSSHSFQLARPPACLCSAVQCSGRSQHTPEVLALSNIPFPQVVVRRGEAVVGPEGPIVVCTRNDDLQAVVDSVPPTRRKGEQGSKGPAVQGRAEAGQG